MKKRIISMLLTVLMLASLVSGMSVSAYADDGEYVEHSMKSGETVLKICQDLGLNYYDTTIKQAIMKLNNITSEADFRFLSIGKVIKIPASQEAAANIIKANSTTGGTAATPALPNGNKVAYYLIPYTLSRGETVYGVCSALGVNYTQNTAKIMALNGLSSLDWVKAGSTLWFPTATVPAAGVTCIQVQAHTIAAGETAISICNGLGVNYHGNIKLLQALNGNNLDNIKAGATFYVPVATTITASSTGASGNANATTPTTNNTNTGTAKDTTTQNGVTKYQLNMNVSTGGSAAFYVNGSVATAAAAGEIVTIVPVAAEGKALKSVELVYADGSAAPNLYDGATFVMPACAVKATVKFSSGYDVNISSAYANKVKVLVNGVSSYSASKGDDVQIVSADPAMSVEGELVICRADNGKVWKTVKAEDGAIFEMPSFAVTVNVQMKAVKTYSFYKSFGEDDGSGNLINNQGTFVLQVSGSTVARAAEGTVVTVVPVPVTGYSVKNITATAHVGGTKLTITNGTFVMPAGDVDINVTFSAGSSTITTKASSRGTVKAVNASDQKITVAETNSTVNIIVSANAPYVAGEPVVTSNIDGTLVAVKKISTDKYSFVIPGGGVTITGQFTGAAKALTSKSYLGDKEQTNPANALMVNNKKYTGSVNIEAGSLVNLDVDMQAGYKFVEFKVYKAGALDKDLTNSANADFNFIMPDGEVRVDVYCKADVIKVHDKVLDSCTVVFLNPKDFNKSITEYSVGEEIFMLVLANPGYNIDETDLNIYNQSTKAYEHPTKVALTEAEKAAIGAKYGEMNGGGVYKFAGPAVGFDLFVTAKVDTYTLTAKAGADYVVSDVIMTAEGRSFVMDLGRAVSARETVAIQLHDSKIADGYVLKSLVYKYTDVDGKAQQGSVTAGSDGKCLFKMPLYDTTIELTLGRAAVSTYTVKYNVSNAKVTFYKSDDLNAVTNSYLVGSKVNMKVVANQYCFIDSIEVVETATGKTVALSPNSDGMKDYYEFTMPAGGATVNVKAAKHNVVIKPDAKTSGNIRVIAEADRTLTIDNPISSYAGFRCTVLPSAELLAKDKNSKVTALTVTTCDGSFSVTADSQGKYVFNLPDPADGEVILSATTSAVVNITKWITVNANGADVSIQNVTQSKAVADMYNDVTGGDKLEVKIIDSDLYNVYSVSMTDGSGNVVSATKSGATYTLNVPANGLNIDVATAKAEFDITKSGSIYADCPAKAAWGETVTITVNPDYELVSVKAVTTAGNIDIPINGNSFVMPQEKVTIVFATNLKVGTVSFSGDDMDGKYQVKADGVTKTVDSSSVTVKAKVGSNVEISVVDSTKYKVTKISYYDGIGWTEVTAVDGVCTFKMPKCDITIKAFIYPA